MKINTKSLKAMIKEELKALQQKKLISESGLHPEHPAAKAIAEAFKIFRNSRPEDKGSIKQMMRDVLSMMERSALQESSTSFSVDKKFMTKYLKLKGYKNLEGKDIEQLYTQSLASSGINAPTAEDREKMKGLQESNTADRHIEIQNDVEALIQKHGIDLESLVAVIGDMDTETSGFPKISDFGATPEQIANLK